MQEEERSVRKLAVTKEEKEKEEEEHNTPIFDSGVGKQVRCCCCKNSTHPLAPSGRVCMRVHGAWCVACVPACHVS